MELKQKYDTICSIFEKQEGETFSQMIERVLFSPRRVGYCDRYCQIFSLASDELRSCWQFFHADRETKKQDYTSDALADLLAALLSPQSGETVYDCCAGSGALSIGIWRSCPDVSFICEELDDEVLPLLLFNLSVRNVSAKVRCVNTLTREASAQWELTRSASYSTIERQLIPDSDCKADISVSNPPFNLKENGESLNFRFVKQCTSNSGRGAYILPTGVLSNTQEKDSRKELIEEGGLRSVITLPGGFFESTGVCVCVLLTRKGTASDGVMLVDAETLTTDEVRHQRGESHNAGRVYKKILKIFTHEQLAALVALTARETEVSTFASREELEKHEHILLRGRYMTFTVDEDHTVHRDFNQIIRDINRMNSLRNTLKLTINKTWAKELGLDVIAQLQDQGKQTTAFLNTQLEAIGISEKLGSPDYIALSASKVLKIEQTDKEELSPAIRSFIPLLAQHIFTMNNLETQLLAELRDSLLPGLMSGRIRIEQETKHTEP